MPKKLRVQKRDRQRTFLRVFLKVGQMLFDLPYSHMLLSPIKSIWISRELLGIVNGVINHGMSFALSKLGEYYTPPTNIAPREMPFICQWILSAFNKAIAKTILSLESYDFSDAATTVYSFWQFQLCDVFIEVIKPYFVGDNPESVSARRAGIMIE